MRSVGRWFSNRRVGAKLAMLSAAVVAVLLVVALLAWGRMGSLRASSSDIYSSNVQPINEVGKLRADFDGLLRLGLLDGLSQDPAAKANFESQIATTDKAVDADAQAYSSTLDPTSAVDAPKRDGMAQFTADLTAYRQIRDSAYLAASHAQNAAVMSTILTQQMIPKANDARSALANVASAELNEAKDTAAGAARTYHSAVTELLVLVCLAVLIAVVLSWLVARTITRPIAKTLTVLDNLAKGDLAQEVDAASGDELGRMGQALNASLRTLRDAVAAIAESSAVLASSSEELSAVSTQMGGAAGETSTQAESVAAAAEQVNQNVSVVAAAAEQMASSIQEIAGNATRAASVATGAVGMGQTALETVAQLSASSAEIGAVVDVIRSIAEQTNLLALNATIEAARAGEAGKGFAVVASEVKDLAQETAKATADITAKIDRLQDDANAVGEVIAKITSVVGEINDTQSTIASAVEEQTATTTEISRSVQEAASGSGEISRSITGVAAAASQASDGASNTQNAAGELARLATELQTLVGQFSY